MDATTNVDPFSAVASLPAAPDETGTVRPPLTVDPTMPKHSPLHLRRFHADVKMRLTHAPHRKGGGMSTTTHEIPRQVLHLLEVPSLNDQSGMQVRGAACVWDGAPLTAETAVELGERRHRRLDGRYSTFPRGCAPCVAARAHRALLDHGGSCEQCLDNRELCYVGRTLYRLVRNARR
ncbi:hypothetical protein [Streptomyces sp. NPDC049915]|uniref:hypothetical protein n=1 Tax=Streptomyces sp. NPDC049915 TaxID=3155510 RepID=UPI0034295E83